MKKQEENKTKGKKNENLASAECGRDCHLHGDLRVRGRIFQGTVVSKSTKRVTIEFERMVYISKYERYAKSKTKIHARLPNCMEDKINVGDYIKVGECRPLSKIIHFVVIEKIKDASENTEAKKVKTKEIKEKKK